MQAFVKHTGVVAPLPRANVDTDQLIPKRFLTRIERTGYGDYLLYNWRFLPDGNPDSSFELNRPAYQGATIMVAGRNFGSGSSREHAVWALLDYGVRTVIAPSFGDIFYNNACKNGLLPVVLPEVAVEQILEATLAHPGYHLTVDLERCVVADAGSLTATFDIEPFRRHCLLHGLDDIGLTLQHEAAIARYETAAARLGRRRGESA